MPQLNPEFWVSQIVWLVITFGALYIVLSKVILPKISDNLEIRRSQILENIEIAEKQREESEQKVKEFEKIILNSKIEAKNIFNEARQKVLSDIDKKRNELENSLEQEIVSAEKEIKALNTSSIENIKQIATETSSNLIKQLIGEEISRDNISSIVNEIAKKESEKRDNV
jgi:F-type H+-transporting ATPase subunit b